MRISVRGLDLHNAFAHLQDGDVERSPAEVVNGYGLILLFVQPVSQRRGGRLIDDAHYVQPSDLSSVLGRLPLAVIEVRGDCDYSLLHLFSQILLRCLTHLLQNHRGYFRGRIELFPYLHIGIRVGPADHFVRYQFGLFLDLT